MRDTRSADADVVVVGAGAAGLSLAWRLVRGAAPAALGAPGPAAPSVLLVEPPPGPVRSPVRTWCFWEDGPGEFDDLLTASWGRLSVVDGQGRETSGACGATYKMLRSTDYARELGARLDSSGAVRRVTGTVGDVRDITGGAGRGAETAGAETGAEPAAGETGAETTGVDADGRAFRFRSRWVFDSRPPRRLPPARTTLLQHFRGWFLRTERACFDPSVARLMDFRTRQPPGGVAFVYLLPIAEDRALAEYTVFSSEVSDARRYEDELRRYVGEVLGLGTGEWTVTSSEHGVIPMTDGVFPRRAGASVFRVGAAGGAVRPSTGYAFAAIQRQAAAVAAACREGRTPLPPDPHSRRHRTMDAVLLRALATGRVDGAAFLAGLFRRNPPERVLRFLDGRSSLVDEWAMGLAAPVLPMVRTLAELPFVLRRVHGGGPPSGGGLPSADEHDGVRA
ncbi:lycopene cyclase family protein [Streptomyces marispadix]|uniref:Lycopene cyclase family protein n=1 Tax=Streptomyces marispadix TaxID=2922868 RepID=A0ABS9SZ21_9ACTN|nr:lycopene cyclase family protein [Streptomyces marispadix]MCH6161523.1 lycopene cyclase family protein [Streptomyces marispadix]